MPGVPLSTLFLLNKETDNSLANWNSKIQKRPKYIPGPVDEIVFKRKNIYQKKGQKKGPCKDRGRITIDIRERFSRRPNIFKIKITFG